MTSYQDLSNSYGTPNQMISVALICCPAALTSAGFKSVLCTNQNLLSPVTGIELMQILSIDNGHGEKWAQDQLNLATISCCQLSTVFIRKSELTILATTSNSMGEGNSNANNSKYLTHGRSWNVPKSPPIA
jgi:hypothetical protein